MYNIQRENCDHSELTFHSGDYYIECFACGAKWVSVGVGPNGDITDVNLCNKGIGCQLSGEKRIKVK